MANQLTTEDILKLPSESQLKILNLWFEANRTSAEKMLEEAEPLLVIYTGVSKAHKDALNNFSDYFRYKCVVELGHISPKRFEELTKGAAFSEEEKEALLQALKSDMLQNFEVEELQRFSVDFNGKDLFATFIGTEHPANSKKRFFGIFESDAHAISEAEKVDISEVPFWLP